MSKEPLEEYKYKEKLSLRDLKSQDVKVHKITCPTCSSTIPADNLNIQTNIAKCNTCDVIFSFENHAEQLSSRNKIIQEILQPEGVELSIFQDEIDISVNQPWGNLEVALLSLLPAILFLGTIFAVETFPPSFLGKAALFTFWIVFISGGIAYFYVRKKHKTNVHINDLSLYIEQRPRKFIKDKHYDIQDIDQVYVKTAASSATGEKGFGIFMIYNGVEGQKHVELIKVVSNRSKAKYIEQEIERHLGIQDRRVPDEVS